MKNQKKNPMQKFMWPTLLQMTIKTLQKKKETGAMQRCYNKPDAPSVKQESTVQNMLANARGPPKYQSTPL